MTPMQKLKPQFDEMKIYFHDWKEVSLNKSRKRKKISCCYGEKKIFENKGVQSDFIKLFKKRDINKNIYSLGFSFIYINEKEENYIIKTTLKIQGAENLFFHSDFLSVEQFRYKLTEVIKKIKISDNNELNIIVDIFKQEFLLKQKIKQKKKIKN